MIEIFRHNTETMTFQGLVILVSSIENDRMQGALIFTLMYSGTPFIKLGKCIAALFCDKLGTDMEIAYQTFEIILYFDLKYLLPALFVLKCCVPVYMFL